MGRTLGLVVAAGLLALGCRGDDKPAAALKPPPKLVGLEPPKVTDKGYRIGYVVGEGFDPKLPVAVYFGDKRSPRAAIVARTKIQVEVPPGVADTEVDVRVEIPGHQPALSPVKLQYESSAHGPPPADEPDGPDGPDGHDGHDHDGHDHGGADPGGP